MSVEKLCQRFLKAAAAKVRSAGLARGRRMDYNGQVCMLGAMDHCGIQISGVERQRIDAHVASLLPPRPAGQAGIDTYNYTDHTNEYPMSTIAWWSNTVAMDAEDVAAKLELAAECC